MMQMGGNQILELFKMQFFMKFLNGDSQQKSPTGQMWQMFLLMCYDHVAKNFPQYIAAFTAWVFVLYTTYINPSAKKQPLDLQISTPQPPPEKKIRAFIQFERNTESKISDPRIDAVIHHVCHLPDVKSLRFNGIEMVPNFTDKLMIDNDIWFEITQQPSGGFSLLGGKSESRAEPIVYKLSTYDHDIKWLHQFVERTIEAYEQEKKNKLGNEMYYFDHITTSGDLFRNPLPRGTVFFRKSKFSSNRTLKNVYMRQCADLQKRTEFFMKRRDWYDSKGIPHTLGIVMYGHPGCGKTSTIKALANETKRHIFNIMLSEIKTKEALKELFYNDLIHYHTGERMDTLHIPVHKRIYVIEDIDAMDSIVLKRTADQIAKEAKKKEEKEKELDALKKEMGQKAALNMLKGKDGEEEDALDLATLLNVLDGVRETPGRIIVLSTNYPERLDEALLRPGRFDMMIEYEKHPISVLQEHVEKYYDVTLTKAQREDLSAPHLEKKWTPAEVSQILFKYLYSLEDAIRCLVEEDPETTFRFSHRKDEGVPSKSLPDEPMATSLEDLARDSESETLDAQFQLTPDTEFLTDVGNLLKSFERQGRKEEANTLQKTQTFHMASAEEIRKKYKADLEARTQKRPVEEIVRDAAHYEIPPLLSSKESLTLFEELLAKKPVPSKEYGLNTGKLITDANVAWATECMETAKSAMEASTTDSDKNDYGILYHYFTFQVQRFTAQKTIADQQLRMLNAFQPVPRQAETKAEGDMEMKSEPFDDDFHMSGGGSFHVPIEERPIDGPMNRMGPAEISAQMNQLEQMRAAALAAMGAPKVSQADLDALKMMDSMNAEFQDGFVGFSGDGDGMATLDTADFGAEGVSLTHP